ncbi:MAG: MBL fold metallo-hydrolase [Leptolinea sp.]
MKIKKIHSKFFLLPILISGLMSSCLHLSDPDDSSGAAIQVQPPAQSISQSETGNQGYRLVPTIHVNQSEELAVTATNKPVQPPAGLLKFATDNLVLHFLPVGQGEAILLQSPHGRFALIDTGPARSPILAALEAAGVDQLDWLILTHNHPDHTGGLDQVLKAIPVGAVAIDPFFPVDQMALDEMVRVEIWRYRQVIQWDGVELTVINPNHDWKAEENEGSLALRLRWNKSTADLMADVGETAEYGLVRAGLPLKADLLKLGHHGSATATGGSFLDVVKPTVAVYSAGLNNQYNLPNADLIQSIRKRGIRVFGTDVCGWTSAAAVTNGWKIFTQFKCNGGDK